MNRLLTRRTLLLCVGLLSACAAVPPAALPPASGGSGDDVPSVPRLTRPAQPDCSVRSLASQLSGGDLARLSYTTFAPSLKAQANAATLSGLLTATRTAINTNYYGFSTVDLQALHETWEARFRAAFGSLKQAIPSAADALMDQYVSGVNDEHTFYLDPQGYQVLQDQGSGAPTPSPRFGFQFAAVPGEDGAVLTDVGAGTPAENAGLKRGDTILSVNGAALSRNNQTDGEQTDDAAASAYSGLLGAAVRTGQSVTLGIRRGETRLSVAVTPRIIASSALPSGQLVGSAYLLRIPSFATEGTAQRVHGLVRAAQSAGATRLIVDLRGNRGGLVSEATAVSAAFAPKLAGQTLEFLDAQDYTFFYQASGVVGQVAVRGVCFSGSQTLTTIQNPALWTGLLDVLVNADSASASEVVTETLQKVGASALGETTVGVGNTATQIGGLPGGRGLSVTVARSRALDGPYLTAKVAPNVLVADDLKALAHGSDLPLQSALSGTP